MLHMLITLLFNAVLHGACKYQNQIAYQIESDRIDTEIFAVTNFQKQF
jgi:hypothetical protein